MRNYIQSGNILEIKDILDLCNQLSIALIYLHTNGCCYGELKLSNILINKKGEQLLFYLDFEYKYDALSNNIYFLWLERYTRDFVLFTTWTLLSCAVC